MTSVTQVVYCASDYYNPNLAERTRFRAGCDGRFTVKFRVETRAQRRWLSRRNPEASQEMSQRRPVPPTGPIVSPWKVATARRT